MCRLIHYWDKIEGQLEVSFIEGNPCCAGQSTEPGHDVSSLRKRYSACYRSDMLFAPLASRYSSARPPISWDLFYERGSKSLRCFDPVWIGSESKSSWLACLPADRMGCCEFRWVDGAVPGSFGMRIRTATIRFLADRGNRFPNPVNEERGVASPKTPGVRPYYYITLQRGGFLPKPLIRSSSQIHGLHTLPVGLLIIGKRLGYFQSLGH